MGEREIRGEVEGFAAMPLGTPVAPWVPQESRAMVLVLNESRKTLLASRVRIGTPGSADEVVSVALSPGEGLWVDDCRSLDTRRIAGSLDVMFLDRDSTVVVVFSDLKPSRRKVEAPTASSMLALPPGTIEFTRTAKGDRVVIEPVVAEPRQAS